MTNPYIEMAKGDAIAETTVNVKLILEYMKETKEEIRELKQQVKELKEKIKSTK